METIDIFHSYRIVKGINIIGQAFMVKQCFIFSSSVDLCPLTVISNRESILLATSQFILNAVNDSLFTVGYTHISVPLQAPMHKHTLCIDSEEHPQPFICMRHSTSHLSCSEAYTVYRRKN